MEKEMAKWICNTASKCPIGLRAFRSYPCGTNNPWGKKSPPTDGSFTLYGLIRWKHSSHHKEQIVL